MKRISAWIEIDVSPATCIHAVQQTMTDERLLAAYRELREGKQYAGFVTMLVPERHMVIEFAALDPMTNKRSHSAGWRVIYDFTAGRAGTRVEVAIEYGWLTAIAAGGFARVQAENEIEYRLAGLRMLEAGVQSATGGTPA